MESNNLPGIVRQLSETELQQLLIYILNRLSFPLANDSIQLALRGLLARASDQDLSKILPNAPSSISKTNAEPSTTSEQPKDIRIKSAVSVLRNVMAIDSFDEYGDPGSFWVREVTILDNFSPTDEPIVRYDRLHKAKSKAKKEGVIVEQLLFLLQIHERDNVLEMYKARNSEATTFGGRKESNAYLADTHDLDTEQVKKLVKGWNKLISLMQRHGPGVALRLGGGTSTWVNMTRKECTAMEIYLKRYRPEVLQQSSSLDLKAAQFLRSGLSRAGMVDDVDGLRRTKLGSIILQYTEVEDGQQNAVVDEDTEDEEAVEEVAQLDETVDAEYDEAVKSIASILEAEQPSKETQLPSTDQPDGECGIHQTNTYGQSQSARTRKRRNEYSQNTPRSRRRRLDVPRSGAATTTTCGANTNNENAEVGQLVSSGADCGPHVQSSEPQPRQASPLATPDQQAAPVAPSKSFPILQSSEDFRQPALYSQQSESTQNLASNHVEFLVNSSREPSGQQDEAEQFHEFLMNSENWDQHYQEPLGQQDEAEQFREFLMNSENWDQHYQEPLGQQDEAEQFREFLMNSENWDQHYREPLGNEGQNYVQSKECLTSCNWNHLIAHVSSVQNNVSDSRTPISV
ncbi:hypothetical protein DPV78_003430 [Talaromyces pinophilus]|nr:hypothetical protein DPV78_003430 [Talaromyces pinophilus]